MTVTDHHTPAAAPAPPYAFPARFAHIHVWTVGPDAPEAICADDLESAYTALHGHLDEALDAAEAGYTRAQALEAAERYPSDEDSRWQLTPALVAAAEIEWPVGARTVFSVPVPGPAWDCDERRDEEFDTPAGPDPDDARDEQIEWRAAVQAGEDPAYTPRW